MPLEQAKHPSAHQEPEKDSEEHIREVVTKKSENHLFMPEETLQRLLTSLDQFEDQQLFTSTSISLSFLSTHLHTNTKYLSYLIKQYKQKDFNSYINDLRINYIIKQLKEDAEWRKYKISILAEKAGFSSHSKFTSIFKTYTGLSPSVFIQYLAEEEPASVKL
ncbi:helix-turn-helix domain-containing protein [Niabella hibiscisoli]|uniref:helix-turn-helix domain-containing protein n=1 Tax=Niabella hibiscisoli TaxID=1825928 RepID=UPI001F10126E|nr:helix-turn-helix domain-containing protein [Niabella hibiscisoli]MCH5719572.1 helix-turn-helix domain-containing protein [Niabella hibiscisoli]